MIIRSKIEELYLEEKHSMLYLCKYFHISPKSLKRYFDEFGIMPRKRHEMAKIANIGRKISEETRAKLRNRPKYKGEKSSNWKGGTWKNHDGYILSYTPNHPMAMSNGYMMQHRLVMENYLKRYLTREEVIDHINGIKDDNRIENLRLFATHSEHIKTEFKRGRYIENIKRLTQKFKGNPMYGKTPWNKGLTINK